MSYLKYANLAADMVRSALKEPLRGKAKAREAVYFRSAVWKDGKPQEQGELLARGRCERRRVWGGWLACIACLAQSEEVCKSKCKSAGAARGAGALRWGSAHPCAVC